MANDRKRATNARYLAQFQQVALRYKPEALAAVKAAAAAAGESVAGYIQKATTDRMAGGLISDDDRKAAGAAAEANGEELEGWISRAIRDQAKRDEMIRQLRKG